MKKLSLNLITLACCLGLISWKMPDYGPAFAITERNIDEQAKKQLYKLTGNQTLTDLGAHLSPEVLDTVNKYIEPIQQIKLSGLYKLHELDKVVRPLNLGILYALDRFKKDILDPHLSNNRRTFALQVFIALRTGAELPLPGVNDLPPRDAFVKHDIFIERDDPDYKNVSATTFLIAVAYRRGIRISQAKGDAVLIKYYLDQAYEGAGARAAGELNDISWHLAHPAPPGAINEPVGDDTDFGYTEVPGQEPYYRFGTARFAGTEVQLDSFFDEHLVYPKKEWRLGIEGRIMARFIVEKDGSLSDIQVPFGLSPDIDAEVIRVLKLCPEWVPMQKPLKGTVRSEMIMNFYFLILKDEQRDHNLKHNFLDVVFCPKKPN